MAKFHINKHGVPAPCKAQPGNCPLGNEDFKKSYSKFLKSKQGPTKELFGKKIVEVEDPYGESTKQFYKDYIQRHSK